MDVASLVCINQRQTQTNWSEFRGGPQAGQGAGVLALWEEAEGAGSLQVLGGAPLTYKEFVEEMEPGSLLLCMMGGWKTMGVS